MTYRKNFFITLLTSVLAFFTLTSYAITANNTTYLYIQNADGAKLVASSTKPNTYKLILRNVAPFVIYFSDRPVRKSGIIPASQFIQLWHNGNLNGFGQDAPNAAINGVSLHRLSLNHRDKSVVFTLSNPVYNANLDQMTYTATVVSGHVNLPKSMKLKNVALFFDGWCPGCV